MIDLSTVKGRVIAAAMRLAAERPWEDITFLDIAGAAGANLAEVRREFSGKGEILSAFARIVDDHVLARAGAPQPGQTARDRLFDVVMSRFDALGPYRAALRSIAAGLTGDPVLMKSFIASQAWMLRAAGIPTEGALGALRIAGFASIYASVFRTWLADEDPGLARTMAVLDRRLRRGEDVSQWLTEAADVTSRLAALVTPPAFRLWRRRAEAAGSAEPPPRRDSSAPAA